MIIEQPHWRTIDERGVTFPWYTRPCLEWLDKLPIHEMRVFEYGVGVSSLWYKSRGCEILGGVDSNQVWVWLRNQHIAEGKDWYIKGCEIWDELTDSHIEEWDLIIIDGDFRDDCTEHALKHLKKGGFLICDNFEQASADLKDWPKTRELTKNLPVTFYKEPEHQDWVTAVFQNV